MILRGGKFTLHTGEKNKQIVCVPLERQQLPDPLQVAVTELHHVKQSLLLLTAQNTKRLGVKVLQ